MSMTAGSGVEVVAIDTPALGDRSYLAHDGQVAVVVDPQRDIDRVLDLAAARGVRITHVFETHLHNDYVTGGLALARATGAAYHVNAADPVAFDRVPAGDRDLIEVSPVMRVRVIATPGHTFTHLSYVLEAAGRAHAVFTGGSLLYGSTGRPDLLGSGHAEELAHAQFASAHRLAAELPEDADVYPTHGFGSFCSATQSEGTSSTIGRERRANPALILDEDRYVTELLAGLDAYPAYYAHMGPANAAGPSGADLSVPRRADAAELRRRIEAGEWVVDLRARRAFAAGHLAGTLELRPGRQLRHLPGLADPLGHAADPAGPNARAGRRGAAGAGPDRHRPPRRGRHRRPPRLGRRPGPAQLPRRRLRRPGGRAPPPPGRDPGRAPRPGMGRLAHRRRRAHPHPPAARPPRRRAGGRGVGALPGRVPRLGRRVLPGHRWPHRRRRGRRVPRAARVGLPVDGHLAHAAAS